MMRSNKIFKYALALLSLIILAMPFKVQAQSMGDYCITPPLIGVPTTPNLLLMIDNSASMYESKKSS